MGARYVFGMAKMASTLLLAAAAAAAPLCAQGSLTRLQDPLTGRPTDVLFDFDRPGVFATVGPGATLDLFFQGRDTQGWFLREGPAAMHHRFGPGGWTAPTFTVETAGYILAEPSRRGNEIVYVTNLVDCGPWHPAEAAPVPYLPGAYLHSSGHPGVFRPPCTGYGMDALAVYDAAWHQGGSHQAIEWSYVRLRLR